MVFHEQRPRLDVSWIHSKLIQTLIDCNISVIALFYCETQGGGAIYKAGTAMVIDPTIFYSLARLGADVDDFRP
jgi:hypothetical protein